MVSLSLSISQWCLSAIPSLLCVCVTTGWHRGFCSGVANLIKPAVCGCFVLVVVYTHTTCSTHCVTCTCTVWYSVSVFLLIVYILCVLSRGLWSSLLNRDVVVQFALCELGSSVVHFNWQWLALLCEPVKNQSSCCLFCLYPLVGVVTAQSNLIPLLHNLPLTNSLFFLSFSVRVGN